jgi:membrane fusion protein, copper/silver efflux system
MKRAILAGVTVAAAIAAAGGAFIGVRGHLQSTGVATVALVSQAAAQTSADPIYYQDPDGSPFYALTPNKGTPAR